MYSHTIHTPCIHRKSGDLLVKGLLLSVEVEERFCGFIVSQLPTRFWRVDRKGGLRRTTAPPRGPSWDRCFLVVKLRVSDGRRPWDRRGLGSTHRLHRPLSWGLRPRFVLSEAALHV